MKRKHRWSIWICVSLLAALFVLSVLAPRKWTSVATSPVLAPGVGSEQTAPCFLNAPSTVPLQTSVDEPAVVVQSRVSIERNRFGCTSPLPVTEEFHTRRDTEIEGQLLPPTQPATAEIRRSGSDVPGREIAPPPIRRASSNVRLEYSQFNRIVEIRPLATRDQSVRASISDFAVAQLSDEQGVCQSPTPGSIQLVARQTIPVRQSSAIDVGRRPSESLPNPSKHWPVADDLIQRLEGLSRDDTCADWCRAVQGTLRDMESIGTIESQETRDSLNALEALLTSGFALVDAVEDPVAQSALNRAAFALKRRLAIWSQIVAITAQTEMPVNITISDSAHLRRVLDDVESKLADYEQGQLWHNYLLLDEAEAQYCTDAAADTAECRRLAKKILLRLDYSILTPEHRQFLSQRPFVAYQEAMKRFAVEPVDYFRLLDEVEQYESRRTRQDAVQVAAAQQILRWSLDKKVARLGQRLDTNYRNANVRLTLSQEILNRFVPQEETVTEPINDVILGARTRGCSESTAQLRVKLLPSDDTWRIGLEAKGQVVSETCSTKGPATFYSFGDASFLAEKQIVVHPYGFYHLSADAAARSSAGLAGLKTNVDPVPILSDIVQAIAKQRYQSQAPAARSEMQNIVARRARSRLDTEVSEQLGQARNRISKHLYQPLEQLALNPIVLQMTTQDERLVARYRLAGHHQLAAHTPRPIAPQGSVVSLQVHESALNNLVEQLHWEGREANLRDLYLEVGKLFAIADLKLPADFPDDVTIRFGSKNAMLFTFEEGRIGFQLNIAELGQGRQRWKNFAVRVHYRPAPERPDADMVRDQYVELAGPRLKFRDQIALRGVFSRVFHKDQPIDFVSRRLNSDPRLEGYHVSQLTVGDGWMGLAIGSQSHGETPRLTQRVR